MITKAFKTILIFGFFLMLVQLTCSVNSWDVYRYKSKFDRNKKELEQLINLLKTQNIRVGYFINQNELPDEITEYLDKLDINDLNLNLTNCEGLAQFEFTTSWCRAATLYFSKDPCDNRQTVKGFHDNSGMIEIWGLGDGWCMWIDHDFI
jgi:hypothetical protein